MCHGQKNMGLMYAHLMAVVGSRASSKNGSKKSMAFTWADNHPTYVFILHSACNIPINGPQGRKTYRFIKCKPLQFWSFPWRTWSKNVSKIGQLKRDVNKTPLAFPWNLHVSHRIPQFFFRSYLSFDWSRWHEEDTSWFSGLVMAYSIYCTSPVQQFSFHAQKLAWFGLLVKSWQCRMICLEDSECTQQSQTSRA